MKSFIKYHIKDSFLLLIENIKLSTFPKATPIIVFTMAKVGSLSVYFSLKKWTKRESIFHIHSLNEKEVHAGIKACFENNIYPGSKSPVFLINKKIINPSKPYKIICLFRDPIERNISAFFDALEFYSEKKYTDLDENFDYLEKLYYNKLPHDYPINWFEKQFFEATKINVYKYDFDSKKGYCVIKENNIEVLLINSNVYDTIKENLIADFCNLPTFKLNNRNISSSKKYANLYKDFKQKIRFDKSYLNQLYNSKYAKHFFSEEHIKSQFEKWSK